MSKEGIAVFTKWALHFGVTCESIRPFVTLTALLFDDEDLAWLQRDPPAGWFDERLAEELLSFADPGEVAALLGHIGQYISPEIFGKVFHRALLASSDIELLSRLMFVAAMFLQFHSGAFQLPRPLVDQLLASKDLDHRLAGIRAVRHSLFSYTEILGAITRVLAKGGWEEKWTALSQLGQVLEEEAHLAEVVDHRAREELKYVLTQIADSATDVDARHAAAHCIALLCPGPRTIDNRGSEGENTAQ